MRLNKKQMEIPLDLWKAPASSEKKTPNNHCEKEVYLIVLAVDL